MVQKKIIIDTEKYKLPDINYYKIETNKNKIIIGNTFNIGINHYKGWLLRFGGEYKKTANYTILKNGKIYEHFKPKYYSGYLSDVNLNKSGIYILLENKGWLEKGLNGDYYNPFGVKHDSDVYIKKWRNQSTWDTYTKKQKESLINLIECLSIEFGIDPKIPNTNTLDKKVNNGVIFKSNIIEYATDINPSWFNI